MFAAKFARTALDYLVGPLVASFDRAFRQH
jgi:hypothetical protein